MKPAKDKLFADLAEDKEYLKSCLEGVYSVVGTKTGTAPVHNWYICEERVLTVARILNRWGGFTSIDSEGTAKKVIDFFEDPRKFEKEMRFIIEEM